MRLVATMSRFFAVSQFSQVRYGCNYVNLPVLGSVTRKLQEDLHRDIKCVVLDVKSLVLDRYFLKVPGEVALFS